MCRTRRAPGRASRGQARSAGRRLAVLVLVALAGGCSSPGPPDRVVLGATLPLSGAQAAAGIAIGRGYGRAVAEANAAGGVTLSRWSRRVPVVLALLNDRGETPVAERAAESLVAQGVHVLLGTHTAVRATAQALVAERAACPYVTNTTDAPGLPGSRMQWVVGIALPPSARDPESRAYEAAKGALALVERSGSPDRHAIRAAMTR